MRLEWTACRQAITLARIRAHSRLIGIFIVVGSFLSGLSGSFKKAHRDGGEPLAAPGNDPRSGEQFLDSIPRWALDLSRASHVSRRSLLCRPGHADKIGEVASNAPLTDAGYGEIEVDRETEPQV
jgi:hypothetical protein